MGRVINYELVLILIISRLRVYIILFSGWASNSKYALLGAYRGVAQTISYEVRFSFILLRLVLLRRNFKLKGFEDLQNKSFWVFFGFYILFIIWLLVILAETNRSPFDLLEGESELVSGFNVEFGGVSFAILFIAEYGNIIFFSWVTRKLFFCNRGIFIIKILIIILFFFDYSWYFSTFSLW